MGYDAYKQSNDFLHEGSLADYVKLGTDVFEKTSKSRMRFGLAARALGQTMKQCILSNGPKVERASWILREVGTDGSIANNHGAFLMKIVKTKGNTGHVKQIDARE